MSYRERILEVAMARGTAVLDENITGLKPYLENFNIRILTPEKGMSDPEIVKTYGANRILITINDSDFTHLAPAFDMGIITFESNMAADLKRLADKISQAITKHSLWSKRHGFIVTIKADGTADYQPLTQ